MADQTESKLAAPILVEHVGRKLEGWEWASREGAPPLVFAARDCTPEIAGALAERLSKTFRVIAVPVNGQWDIITAAWWAGEPVVLVAQGEAGALACRAADTAKGAFKALVLADYAPAKGSDDHRCLAVPALVFRGRQSDAQTHLQAVALHEEIAGSHLVEPEDCGATPSQSCAGPFSQAIEWFVATLGETHMDYATGQTSVDPAG